VGGVETPNIKWSKDSGQELQFDPAGTEFEQKLTKVTKGEMNWNGTDLGIGSIFDQMSGSAWSSGSKCIFEVV
jgi:hypothetical protein